MYLFIYLFTGQTRRLFSWELAMIARISVTVSTPRSLFRKYYCALTIHFRTLLKQFTNLFTWVILGSNTACCFTVAIWGHCQGELFIYLFTYLFTWMLLRNYKVLYYYGNFRPLPGDIYIFIYLRIYILVKSCWVISYLLRMVSSGLLRRVALVRTDVSEEPGASFISMTIPRHFFAAYVGC
jgi:hypothetical protein